MAFRIDMNELNKTGRVMLGSWTWSMIRDLSRAIDDLAMRTATQPVQRGRVIALRYTDDQELFSAFKTSLYHGRYDDAGNTGRFVSRMVSKHQSLEPIRGESVLFLFVGVSKSVYDALTTFGHGKLTRISGGFHHTVPWGVETPVFSDDPIGFMDRNMARVSKVAELATKGRLSVEERRKLNEARYELPYCYIVPPFAMEFSVEALATKVFPQRLWEPGVAERDSGVVVQDMWDCCCAFDLQRFRDLREYYGPQVNDWQDAVRNLRDGMDDVERFTQRMLACARESGKPSAYEAFMAACGVER